MRDASASGSAAVPSAALAAAGDEGPSFARDFPDDPELAKLVALFELGNYIAVRDGVRTLVRATDRDDVRRAARELERRTEADPLAKVLLGLGAALLLVLAYWYWSHPHPGP